MAIIEKKLARGYRGLIEIAVLYDDKTHQIVGIKTTDNSQKTLKPTVQAKTSQENCKETGAEIKLEKDYFMVADEEYGHLITPQGFEVELNIPFA